MNDYGYSPIIPINEYGFTPSEARKYGNRFIEWADEQEAEAIRRERIERLREAVERAAERVKVAAQNAHSATCLQVLGNAMSALESHYRELQNMYR